MPLQPCIGGMFSIWQPPVMRSKRNPIHLVFPLPRLPTQTVVFALLPTNARCCGVKYRRFFILLFVIVAALIVVNRYGGICTYIFGGFAHYDLDIVYLNVR